MTVDRHPLRYDPIAPLVAATSPALNWAVRNDILDEEQDPRVLWTLPRVVHARRWQNPDGSWTYHGGSQGFRSRQDYQQLATYQELLLLVSLYRLDRRHPVIRLAAKSVLSNQKPEGDIRGIYGTQYTPNYTADMLRLLIEAGYTNDRRVVKGLDWLMSVRQDDGGWAIPVRTATTYAIFEAMRVPKLIEPNRSKPSSHLVTGIVLRAMAAHPSYRHLPETRRAARWLAGRFLTDDTYLDRKAADYWSKLSFPFRWTDVVSALDSIGLVGVHRNDQDVARGIRWLIENQRPDGLWRTGYPNSSNPLADHWVSFAATRTLKRFFGRAILETLDSDDAAA